MTREIVRLTAEASDLGWAPGVWPTHFKHGDHFFHFARNQWDDGEIVAVIYEATSFITGHVIAQIQVFND